jgi:hypothetical protein
MQDGLANCFGPRRGFNSSVLWRCFAQQGDKSGGKPAFLTLRLLNSLDYFTLKAIQIVHIESNQGEITTQD